MLRGTVVFFIFYNTYNGAGLMRRVVVLRLVGQGIRECRTSRVCFHVGVVIKIHNFLFCFIVVRSEAQVPGYFGNKTWSA